MLESVFLQHPEQATFLVLSDTNVFFDDPGGRKLATEHASKFNLRIFRFNNPVFAEGDQANAAIIEDGDEEDGGTQPPTTTAKPEQKKEKEKEGEVTSEVSAQAAAEQKKAAAAKVTTNSKSTAGGVKAKTR